MVTSVLRDGDREDKNLLTVEVYHEPIKIVGAERGSLLASVPRLFIANRL
jgi:hypothetical protein